MYGFWGSKLSTPKSNFFSLVLVIFSQSGNSWQNLIFLTKYWGKLQKLPSYSKDAISPTSNFCNINGSLACWHEFKYWILCHGKILLRNWNLCACLCVSVRMCVRLCVCGRGFWDGVKISTFEYNNRSSRIFRTDNIIGYEPF